MEERETGTTEAGKSGRSVSILIDVELVLSSVANTAVEMVIN